MAWASVCISGKASTLLRNLFFLSFAVLLTACTNHGGGYGSFKLLDTGGPEQGRTCENTSFHDHYCATGEHPNLCDCWYIRR